MADYRKRSLGVPQLRRTQATILLLTQLILILIVTDVSSLFV